MTKSTDHPRRPDTGEHVTAVIYDRLATPSRAHLDLRLATCREYAAERGWCIAAEHTDTGDAALHDRSRPGLEGAIKDVHQAANENATDQAVLLVLNHGRLSHDAMNLALWRHRVDEAGGTVVTVEPADAITRTAAGNRTEAGR